MSCVTGGGSNGMISAECERRILELLESGVPVRAISRMTGLCRETIARRRLGYRRSGRSISREMPPGNGRCPGCGAKLIRWPCHACAIRALMHGGSTATDPD